MIISHPDITTPVNDPIENVRDCARSVHEQFEDDLRRGDAKAAAMFGMLAGEMNAARKSLGLPPLTMMKGENRSHPS